MSRESGRKISIGLSWWTRKHNRRENDLKWICQRSSPCHLSWYMTHVINSYKKYLDRRWSQERRLQDICLHSVTWPPCECRDCKSRVEKKSCMMNNKSGKSAKFEFFPSPSQTRNARESLSREVWSIAAESETRLESQRGHVPWGESESNGKKTSTFRCQNYHKTSFGFLENFHQWIITYETVFAHSERARKIDNGIPVFRQ